MAKIKYTKTEQKHQQDALKQFQRFLPTLQLRKQQLQFEVRQSAEALEANLAAQKELEQELAGCIAFFGNPETAELVTGCVKVERVISGSANIAGINIPTFDHVEFEESSWDLFATGWYVDDAINALKSAVSLREAYRILEEQHRLLSEELRTTSQRVNLFEKVKIPECKENIRKIRIMLGDMDTAAVARSKIAKSKGSAHSEDVA
jgi:V/A-type H+-transporting ATPase subunit D